MRMAESEGGGDGEGAGISGEGAGISGEAEARASYTTSLETRLKRERLEDRLHTILLHL